MILENALDDWLERQQQRETSMERAKMLYRIDEFIDSVIINLTRYGLDSAECTELARPPAVSVQGPTVQATSVDFEPRRKRKIGYLAKH